jgi:hypothetical protein
VNRRRFIVWVFALPLIGTVEAKPVYLRKGYTTLEIGADDYETYKLIGSFDLTKGKAIP